MDLHDDVHILCSLYHDNRFDAQVFSHLFPTFGNRARSHLPDIGIMRHKVIAINIGLLFQNLGVMLRPNPVFCSS